MRRLMLLAALALPTRAYAADAPAATRPAPLPEPLAAPKFKLPPTVTKTLSNGLRVVIATNPEVPLWDVRVVFDVGGFADPVGKEGVAAATFDMLNEGAAGMTAEELSRELKRLGSSLETRADDDGAIIAAAGLTRNLAPTLDLLTKILLQPEFPAADWEINRSQRLADLAAARQDPGGIMTRVTPHVLYGDTYRGRLVSDASLTAITADDLRAWYGAHVGPQNAIILVGGALKADEIVPLLEARLGQWKPANIQDPKATPKLTDAKAATLYLIDKPGAAQSVVRSVQPVGLRTDPDYYDLVIANTALGGAFTSRVNMNLREEKGYTYGARCGFIFRYGPGLWTCTTSVETTVTAPAIMELRGEIMAAIAAEPLTKDEIGFYRESESRGYAGQYEVTGAILDEKADIWRYGLPADWTERYLTGVGKVQDKTANAALSARLKPDQLTWIVVGDAAKIRPGLETLGLPIVMLDRDGNPVKAAQ